MKRITSIILSQALLLCSLSPAIARAEMFGDINDDGSVNATDASYILQYSAYVGAGGELSLSTYMEYDNKGETPPVKLSSFADSADSSEYVQKMSEIIDITDVHYIIGPEQYNTLNAQTFKYNGKEFRIFQLNPNDSRLEEAKSGKVIMKPIEGSYYTEYETLACSNGNFLLTYKESDEAVLNAFMQ